MEYFVVKTAGQASPESAASAASGPTPGPMQLNGNGLEFNFIPDPGTLQNVIDGFAEAANLWSQLFNDDIVVNVEIAFAALPPGVLGSTTRMTIDGSYTDFRTALVADAITPSDTTAVANLQSAPDVDLRINYTSDNPNGSGSPVPYVDSDGSANNTTVNMARANAKALGLLPAGDATADSRIVFSSGFAWDFDRSDGITAGTFDFVGVAAHEIGHALGFISGVDVLDINTGTGGAPGPFSADAFTFVTPLDMFRYSIPSVAAGALEWAAGQPAGSQFFSIDGGTTNLATFSTGRAVGDGQQASHWQNNLGLGLMAPTIAPGVFAVISALDVQAVDVIGWNPTANVGQTLADPIFNGTGDNDTFIISRVPTDTSIVQVQHNDVVIFAQQIAVTNSITVNGLGGSDTLIVDFSSGNPIPPAGIAFDGGDGDDELILEQGSFAGSFTNVTHTFTSTSTGTVAVDGAIVTYAGLEPIADNLNVANRVFTFTNVVTDGTFVQTPGDPTRTRIDSNQSELVDFATPSNSLTVNLASGASNTFGVNSLADGFNTPTNTINMGDSGDEVNFERTGEFGFTSPWTVNGGAGVDVVNLSPVARFLDHLTSGVTFFGGGGAGDTLNVFDDNNPYSDTFMVTSTTIDRSSWGDFADPGATYDAAVEFVNLLTTGSGNNTINVLSTSPTATTTIDANGGNDVFNINASQLGGQNLFRGGGGDDAFILSVTTAAGISAPVVIEGNSSALGFGRRDVVTIQDIGFGAGAGSPITMTYTGGGPDGSELTFQGIGPGLATIQTVETVAWIGEPGNNDVVTVVGTAGQDDLITVAPLDDNTALVLNNSPTDASGPFNGPPEDFATRIPGVSGGSVRPDLLLAGLDNLAGLTITDPGPGTGDRLYIYGESAAGLNDGSTFDPFGFGPGQILPAVAEPGSFNQISVSDTQATINGYVAVNYNDTDFLQPNPFTDPAVVVNAGDEGNPPATPGTDAADDIALTLSPAYRFQVNGGNPDPAHTGIVPPDGDQMNVDTLGSQEINIWSDKSPVPNVEVEAAGVGALPFGFNSIENLVLDANGGTVNLLGDNNFSQDQTDNFVVRGTGLNAFTLEINGSAPIQFINVTYLNVIGGEEVDTLDITAWADNTPQGWGIQVTFDEGAPHQTDGDQQDLLIYNTVAAHPVSEDIVIQPSGPENGELRVTNAVDGSVIVVISYVNNLDVIVNDNDGYLSDTDTLTLRGTNPDPGNPNAPSGLENFIADFSAAGDVANPTVTVTDEVSTLILYRLRNFTNFNSIHIEPLGGSDYVEIIGRDDGSLTVNVDNGRPAGPGGVLDVDTLAVLGVADADDAFAYFPGATTDAGRVEVLRSGAMAPTVVNFTGTERVSFDGGGGTGSDELTVNATGGDDVITVVGTGALSADIEVNAGPLLRFLDFGSTASDLNLHGGNGDDRFSIAGIGDTMTINVDGGNPTASDEVIVNVATAGVISGLAVDDATITRTGEAVVNVVNAESLRIVGDGSTNLTIEGTAASNTIVHTPGSAFDAGGVQIDNLLPIAYQHLGAGATLVIDGETGDDTLVVDGTQNNDLFTVAAGTVALNDRLVIDSPGIENLTLRGLDGDDTFDVAGDHAFDGIVVEGGNPSASDVLNFTGSGGAIEIDLDAQTVTESGFGAVGFTGIEILNVDAGTGVIDVIGTLGTDDLAVTPTGASSAILSLAGVNFTVHVTTDSGSLSIDLLAAGTNQLTVHGTQDGETIVVDGAQVAVGALLAVNYSNVQNLRVFGHAGDDVFEVTPAAGTTIFIDGGDPIGSSPGDLIILFPAGPFAIEPGPEVDEGGMISAGAERVSWDHIEEVVVDAGGAPALIIGTNGDDDITIIARDESYNPADPGVPNPLLDGVQDFTVSVNGGPDILFIGVPDLFVDALAGDDDIVLRAPVPNGAPWNVQVTIVGGSPSAASGDQGDVFVLESPGQSTVVYTPTGPDTGTILLDQGGSDSLITLAASFDLTGIGIPYISSVGGVELFIYDGEGGDDSFTIVGTVGSDIVTHRPGDADDEGSIRVNNLLGVTYQGLGLGATLSVDGDTGDDTLVVDGTQNNDLFAIVAGTVALNDHLVINSLGIENLTLRGLDGDDTFDVAGDHAFDSIAVEGGDPSASDVLNFTGSGGAIEIDLDAQTVTESGFGPVTFSGVEQVNLGAAGANLTVRGTDEDDTLTYTPTGAEAGLFVLDGLNTVFEFANLSTSVFTVDLLGGDGDHTVVLGTNSHDVITVDAPNRRIDVENIGGVLAPVVLASTVETVTVLGRLGNDTIIVVPAPQAVPSAPGFLPHNLLVHVDGGPPSASDALVVAGNVVRASANDPVTAVVPLGATDFVVVNRSRRADEGTVRVFRNADPMPDISYTDVELVSPFVFVSPAGDPNLLQLGPDMYEANEFRTTAAYLGSGDVINVQNLAIFPNAQEHRFVPADQDWFRVVAEKTGTLDFQVYFRTFDAALLPGGGALRIEVYDAAGHAVSTVFRATADEGARFRIPAVAGQSYYLRVLGDDPEAINAYSITIHNSVPPVPFDIELKDAPPDGTTNPPGGAANSDTGRSQFDNITYDTTPTIFLRLDDAIFLNDVPGNAAPVTPPDWTIPILHNADVNPADANTDPGFRVGIFVENDTHGEVLAGFAEPATDPLFAGAGVYEFTFVDPLDDGSWFISARVQMIDPAIPAQSGWGARSLSLEIIVDSDPPLVSFGGLIPASDTGILPPNPGTIVDLITSDVAPTFWGRAEANAVVRIYADDGDGLFDLNDDFFLGQATAIPIDGTDQFPDEMNQLPGGYWEIRSIVNLNDPGLFPLDGLRTIFVTAEDVAGNVSVPDTEDEVLEIFIDTQGPVIEGVFVNEILVGVNSNNELVQFNSQAPSMILATLPITGLAAGDVVAGIDVRPADGQLYAFVEGVASDRIYRVNPRTGEATFVSTLLMGPMLGTSFGVDFNPVTDQLRIVSNAGENLRVNVLTGVVVVDAALNPGAPTVVAAAYSNNNAGTTATTLYTIDTVADVLNVQLDFPSGFQVLVGPLGVDATAVAGFDIAQGSDNAFASLTVAGVTGLYRIDLATGDATPVDNIGDGSVSVGSLTALPQYDLFDPKPSTDGPTPLVYSISIKFSDLPERVEAFLYDALKQDIAEHPGHYLLVGDYSGPIAIREVIVRQFIQNVADTQIVGPDNIAMATVELVFFAPLPDDRYTLTISDQLVDPVGNRLDGESNAIEPQGDPLFPTGDGLPGGDFVARFTVDSRPELGVWAAGSVYIDTNGNSFWDPNNLDATNRDIMYKLGYTTDHIFAGNFALPGETADGFDKLAAYGVEGNLYRWLIDTTNDGVPNLQVNDPARIIGMPVAGDFNETISGDQVGLFTGTTWHLDTTGNYNVNFVLDSELRGYPIVGDFDGDGYADLATWNYQLRRFEFDLTAGVEGRLGGWDGLIDATIDFGFIGARIRPVAADMDGDGITDVGLWVPDRAGMPDDIGEWYFLISNDFDGTGRSNGTVATLDHPFSPTPLGFDLYARFGNEFAVPLVGNFDPPAGVGAGTEQPEEEVLRPSDLVGYCLDAGQWWLGESNGVDAFTNSKATRWNSSLEWVDIVAADFTGNGLDDIAGRIATTGDWWVAVNNGDGTFTNQKWTRWNPNLELVDVMAADFTGDGVADIAGRIATTGDWWVAESTGTGFTN
ncbi:MAG: NF038122 family metalloprotease, partial [Thermoguttaceae bacterium]|nr:NF038122 family metalloprotease [Thermoguttaceae bacterium]